MSNEPKIEVLPGSRKDLLMISINGEPWREIHTAVFGRYPRFKCPSADQWQRIFDEIEYKKGKQYLLRRLNAQHYHSQQLAKLMKERLIHPKTVDKLIRDCQNWGIMDDQAWVDSFIRSQKKRHGMPIIIAKLKMKGISPDILERIQADYHDPEAEKEAISTLLKTKYRSKDISQFPIRQKVIASLLRRGYSFESIKAAFSRIISIIK